jgi:hypothetical protein
MDIRQIKLELTVDLLNLPNSQSPINYAKEKMDDYKSEIGGFQRVFEKGKSNIGNNIEMRSLALQYEHATLNLDVVEDQSKKEEYLQNFTLLENI